MFPESGWFLNSWKVPTSTRWFVCTPCRMERSAPGVSRFFFFVLFPLLVWLWVDGALVFWLVPLQFALLCGVRTLMIHTSTLLPVVFFAVALQVISRLLIVQGSILTTMTEVRRGPAGCLLFCLCVNLYILVVYMYRAVLSGVQLQFGSRYCWLEKLPFFVAHACATCLGNSVQLRGSLSRTSDDYRIQASLRFAKELEHTWSIFPVPLSLVVVTGRL